MERRGAWSSVCGDSQQISGLDSHVKGVGTPTMLHAVSLDSTPKHMPAALSDALKRMVPRISQEDLTKVRLSSRILMMSGDK